ncbi:putative ribonuclease H-like domain-containing protein [Tanacetum coccineum]
MTKRRKAKSILLLAIPDEYQLKFHAIKDVKTLWAAIKSRFSGNVKYKKMQKNVLKQQFENFFVSDTERLDKAYDSSTFIMELVALIMRNKYGIDDLDIDDLYNNLKVLEADIKGSSGSSSNSHNVTFLSAEDTSSSRLGMVHFARECRDYENQKHMNGDAGVIGAGTTGLESVEAQLIVYQKNKVVYEEKIVVLKFEVKDKSNAITRLKNQLDETLRKNDDLKAKLQQFETSSKNLNKLINSQLSAKDKTGLGYGDQLNENDSSGSELYNSVFDSRSSDGNDNQINDRFKKDNGYHVVPPPLTGNYMPPLADLSFAGLDATVYRHTTNKTSASVSQVEANKPSLKRIEFTNARNESVKPKQAEKPRIITQNPKVDRRDWNGKMTQKLGLRFRFTKKAYFVCGSYNHLIKDCDFHKKRMAKKSVLKNMGKNTGQREIRPVWNSAQRINHQNKFVPSAVLTRFGRVPVSAAKQSSLRATSSTSTFRPVNTATHKNRVNISKLRTNAFYKSHSPIRRPLYKSTAPNTRISNEKVNTVRVNGVNTAGQTAVSAVKGAGSLLLRPQQGNPQQALKNKEIFDSGCSRHMTGSKDFLTNYQDIDGDEDVLKKGAVTGSVDKRGYTTAASLDAAYDNDNIIRTQTMAMPNVDIPQGINTGGPPPQVPSGARHHQGVFCSCRGARSERVLEKPNEPPLLEGHTSGSGDGKEAKTAQDRVINRLKLRVKRLEKKRKARTPQPIKRRLFKGRVETSTDTSLGKDASKQRRSSDKTKKMFKDKVSAATPSTPPTTTTVFDDEDVTMDMAQTLIKMKEVKAKVKGVEFRNVEEASRPIRSITTLQPLPKIDPKDKGKSVLVEEEPKKVKSRDQGWLQIHELYERQQKRNQDFKPMDSEKEVQESEAAECEKEKEELRLSLKIIYGDDSEVNYEPLSKRFPIVNWEYKLLGNMDAKDVYVYKLTRAGGSSSYHGDMQAFLRRLDMQDLNDLYRLVQERFQDHPLEGHDLLLWGDLKMLFDPDEKDELGMNQLDWKLLKWKWHENCGVHTLFMNGLFLPPNLDLSYSGLKEFQQPEFEGYGHKTSKSVSEDTSNEVWESPDASLVEELVSNDKLTANTIKGKGWNMAPRAVLMKTGLRPLNTTRPVNTAHPKTTVFINTAKGKVNTARPKAVNTTRPNTVVVNAVRANQGHPQKEDQGYVDGGCSRHMTGNMSYLSDFKEFDGGYVTFGGGANGGRITGKGTLKTGKLDESMLWHRRLGHVNFKTINKLIKDNLVKGLPIKHFENDQTCVACLKGNNTKPPNGVLVVKPHNKTPYELFRCRTPSLSFMKPFGCHVTILNTLDHLGKFYGKSDDGFFVGYSLNSKDFRVYNIRTRKVEENLHVRYNSNDFCSTKGKYWVGWHSNCMNHNFNDAGKKDYVVELMSRQGLKHSAQDIITARPSINTASTNFNTFSPIVPTAPLESTYANLFSDESKLDLSNIATTYPVPTTPNIRIHKDHLLDHVLGDVQSGEEPKKTLVDLPYGKRAIGTKWVYKNKKDERVARIKAIRLFLAYASFKDFVVYQMDVKSAFLYGKIEEEVYVCQPLGFEDPEFPNKVYKVENALYGQHQAPRAWCILLVQVYVDDIIFGSTKKVLCTEFEKLMHKKFQMSSMGELTFFLGLQVTQKDDGIFISQDNSIRTDIMFAVCACARFQVTPKVSHLHAMKRIFRYLKCQPKLGLWYPKDSPFYLEAYPDSDYAGAIANSTAEAEYVAAASCCGQVLWIQNQMLDYGYNFMNTKIFIDNESTICIVKNPVFHSKTKHIEIIHHLLEDLKGRSYSND